jgi:hypothetical protein
MNERDLNIDRMREAVLKLEITQFARGEALLAREDLREYIRLELNSLRNEIRHERGKLVRNLILVLTILIGGDVWTIWGVFQHAKQTFQQALQIEVDKTQKRADVVLGAETERLRQQIRLRLDQEFETPRIHQVIESEARRYTATEAQSYITTQVDAGLKPFQAQVTQVRQTLADVSNRLEPVKTAVDTYRDVLHTATLATTAMAGSRSAHRELNSLVNSQNADVRQIAGWALEAVDNELLDMLRNQTLNPELGREALLQLSRHSAPTMREKAVERMGVTKDRQYVPRIIEMIRSDPNIRVLRAALIAFNQETAVTVEADETGATLALKWWDEHKTEFGQ